MTQAATRTALADHPRSARTVARPFFAGPVQRKTLPEEATQAKLSVSAPGDRWEREADHMAGQVTSGRGPALGQPAPAARVTPVTAAGLREDPAQRQILARPGGVPEALSPTDELSAQRAEDGATEEEPAQPLGEDPVQAAEDLSTPEAEEEPTQTAPEAETSQSTVDEYAEGETPAQTRGIEPGGPDAAALADRAMARSRGQGDPLPPLVMDRMQSRFGADFQGIRIHTDSAAVQITQALRAQAVTHGSDIYFNAGRFTPDSRTGAELLAHELTHALQQGAAPVAESAAGRADPLQTAAEPRQDESYQVRPEILTAIRLARAEAGKVNAKAYGSDGKRIGWQRLQLYFTTALGGPVIDQRVIEKIIPVPATTSRAAKADSLPSWCGIFTWWAMKEAGLPLPDWSLNASALDALKLRSPGEMPRKGDIAIKVKDNNHFAMVTGLESSTDARGKLKKLTRIATINGNTAGNDNLGGQVQEKWNTIAQWDHFLDPAGKLSLPPVQPVTVSRTPDPVEPAPEPVKDDPAAESERKAAEAKKAAALGELESAPVETLPDETGLEPGAMPKADLTLPPRPPAGPAEIVAEVQAVALDGTSDQAASAWLGASPSAMAAAQPALAGAIGGKLASEQQDLVNNPPKLQAQTAGLDNLPDATPPETSLPSGEVDAATSPNDPGPLDPVKASTPPVYAAGAALRKKLAEEDAGSFWDAFTSFLKSLITDIEVTDPSVSTKAGGAPDVDLSGDADAGRMDSQRGDASEAVGKARNTQVTAFRNHPGQQAIQPVEVDEGFAATPEAEPAEPLEETADTGMADYAASPLPADVRAAADGKLGATMDAALAGPKADATAAAIDRDTGKAGAISAAESEAAQINTDADAAQKKAVLDNRAEVARLQGEGMTEAHGAVNSFNREAGDQQTSTRKSIGSHVRTEEGKARQKITEGETEAESLKTKAEAEAKAEKDALKEREKNASWWDRGRAFLKGVVNAVTKAIDKIFNALRAAVAKVIEAAKNAAIGLINAARDFAIKQINNFRDWAKKQVDTYVADTFPGLAKRINGAIDTVADSAVTVVNTVADGAVAAVEFAAKHLAKALDGILKKFQTGLKAAIRIGAAVVTGDFAAALRIAIEAACEIAGVDPKQIFAFFDRAGKAVVDILKHPVQFISNLFSSVGAGISAFFGNIRTHLISGAIAWLTGALAEVQLTGPFEFTVSGILKIVLQILGLTYDAIKARVIKAYPPAATVFDKVEKGFEVVKKLVAEGPIALFEDIKAQLGDIKDIVMGAVREWLIVTAFKQGVVWLLALTNPASAIVKAVMLLYDLVMFLIERFQQIKDFVMTVYDAVAAIAAGDFSVVTRKVEDALARSVPVLLSLLATVLSLGNIAAKVKSVIAKVAGPINKVIDAVVGKIVTFAKKTVAKIGKMARKAKKKAKSLAGKAQRKGKAAVGKAKQKVRDTAQKVKDFLWPKKRFQIEDHRHTLTFKSVGDGHEPIIRSTPMALTAFVDEWEARAGTPLTKNDTRHLELARTSIKTLKSKTDAVDKLVNAKKPVPKAMEHDMLETQTTLAAALKGLLGTNDNLAHARERYYLEGLAGTYRTVPKPVGDALTGDHQPQAKAIKYLAEKPYFAAAPEGAKMRHRAAGGHADNAYVVNLQANRHGEGRTGGGKGGGTLTAFKTKIEKMEKTAKTQAEKRKGAVDLLKTELSDDVKAMREVYTRVPADPIWDDLNTFFPKNDTKGREKLVKEIKAQVKVGQGLIASQPMNELAK